MARRRRSKKGGSGGTIAVLIAGIAAVFSAVANFVSKNVDIVFLLFVVIGTGVLAFIVIKEIRVQNSIPQNKETIARNKGLISMSRYQSFSGGQGGIPRLRAGRLGLQHAPGMLPRALGSNPTLFMQKSPPKGGDSCIWRTG